MPLDLVNCSFHSFHKILTIQKTGNYAGLTLSLQKTKKQKRSAVDVPLSSAEDHSWTDMSGILLASCMAGTTMLLLSWRPEDIRSH